jgi:hypothetical protein
VNSKVFAPKRPRNADVSEILVFYARINKSPKKGVYSVVISHPWSKSRERHSRASQCEREAFWKKRPTRAAAIESKDLREVRYAAEEPNRCRKQEGQQNFRSQNTEQLLKTGGPTKFQKPEHRTAAERRTL